MNSQKLEQDFLAVYEKHADAIYRYCYFRLYEKERATDCMQEAFTKAWQYIVQGNRVKNIRALVYKIANNLIIDLVRKKKEDSLEGLQENRFTPKSEDRELSAEFLDAKAAVHTLKQLKPDYQAAVYMRYIENLAPREIADILNESPNVISVRIHRGLKQLKTLL